MNLYLLKSTICGMLNSIILFVFWWHKQNSRLLTDAGKLQDKINYQIFQQNKINCDWKFYIFFNCVCLFVCDRERDIINLWSTLAMVIRVPAGNCLSFYTNLILIVERIVWGKKHTWHFTLNILSLSSSDREIM